MSTSATSRSQPGRNNVLEAGDFPIILGESLKKDAVRSKFVRLRYNWTPQSGFKNVDGTLKRVNGQVQLGYRDKKTASSVYNYTAAVHKDNNDHDDDDLRSEQFALVFDPSKSVYVLEKIAQSFDLNLASAHDQSRDEIKKHKQISLHESQDEGNPPDRIEESTEDGDDQPDPKNPFDFRHFLSEAKENAEKAAQPNGNRTPIPGGRTPMSGISSPSLGAAGRFLSTTTQFRSAPTSAPLPKKPTSVKPTSIPPRKPNITKKKPAVAKPASTKPLSSEIVSSSSDEEAREVVTKQHPKPQPREKNHARNSSSASTEQSPHLVVNDGGLDIDYGSPPPEARRKAMLDIGAFRSQTQTPTLGQSSNKPSVEHSRQDIEMRDRSDDDEDEEEYEANDDNHDTADVDMDDDVEELALDSPRLKKNHTRGEEIEKAPSPPTPIPVPAEDDEEEDFLANELLAEMMGQGDDDNGASANVMDDDESEVSEEE